MYFLYSGEIRKNLTVGGSGFMKFRRIIRNREVEMDPRMGRRFAKLKTRRKQKDQDW